MSTEMIHTRLLPVIGLVVLSMANSAAQTALQPARANTARAAMTRAQTASANWTPESYKPLELIKGAPFSAVKTIEGVRAGSDGRRAPEIRPPFRIYRDSEGRMRKEAMSLPGIRPAGTAPAIEIEDPVEGARYALDSAAHIAHRIKVPVRQMEVGIERTQLRPATGPKQPRVQIEKLGMKEIAGVQTEGTRTIITWPAGAVGNDKPRVITSEKWVAVDLKLVVLWRSSDPESSINETVTELDRKEPEASLFKVPSDYQIVDDEAAAVERRGLPAR